MKLSSEGLKTKNRPTRISIQGNIAHERIKDNICRVKVLILIPQQCHYVIVVKVGSEGGTHMRGYEFVDVEIHTLSRGN